MRLSLKAGSQEHLGEAIQMQLVKADHLRRVHNRL